MAEYVKKEDVLALAKWEAFYIPEEDEYEEFECIYPAAVRLMPAADVVEVVHGRWVERKSLHAEGGVSAKCSVCQKAVQYLGNPLSYCPNCGARMDGDK